MTELEWLTDNDPPFPGDRAKRFERELAFVQERLGPRRKRLLAVALCRTVREPYDNADLWPLVDVAEEYADGRVSGDDLARSRQTARELAVKAGAAAERFADNAQAESLEEERRELAWGVSFAAAPVVYLEEIKSKIEWAVVYGHLVNYGPDPAELERVVGRWREAVRKLLRAVAGNPFRPLAFDPAWRSDTAVSLARVMYDSRDFAAMPILADALQDAGCEDEQVLAHCRAPEPHVRGCWVLDGVLGNA